MIEVPTAEMFTKILQEHRAGTGAYDALNVIPSWMPDLVRAGALEPLDDYVDEYGYREELQEIAPVYRDNQMTVDGTIYGFPDDGDVFVFYYRKDIFEENGLEPPHDLGGVRRDRADADRQVCGPTCTARPSSASRPTPSSCSRSASASRAASSSTRRP